MNPPPSPDPESEEAQRQMLLGSPLATVMAMSRKLRDRGHGDRITYSRKVFVPLTQLCRDVCHYCTFAQKPRGGTKAYLTVEEALAIARAGREQGCKEALFTIGDKPELRYAAAREALKELSCERTIDYLGMVAGKVLAETGLLPHFNCGVMGREDLEQLRPLGPSMGLMLESTAPRLSEPGGPHFQSPDKDPEARLECIRLAGELKIPLTTGLLLGIGETRAERLNSLFKLAVLHRRYGHLQELIIQNFVPKPGTRMERVPPPASEEILWTVAAARLVFGSEMSIQAPPNLNPDKLRGLIDAGINDWGGISPVTPDHVNPESPWPHIEALAEVTASCRKVLVERLTIYPPYIQARSQWLARELTGSVLKLSDSEGLAREGEWAAGALNPISRQRVARRPAGSTRLTGIIARARRGRTLEKSEIVELFQARGDSLEYVCQEADDLRREMCGDAITYVVNRNINYTNICTYKCVFCAFSKGRSNEALRGKSYIMSLEEIGQRVLEASRRGATEVCMQGGIHPDFTGETYLNICRTAKKAAPDIHVHAFSPLEISHGARTVGLSVRDYLQELKRAGLGTLPGTAAEILDDSVRSVLCPDKINTAQWIEIVGTAHAVGLRTTSTILFGHMEELADWATHLLALRRLQMETGGITEFVPLPFVHMEAPLYRRGLARRGPTFREARLMHAVSRLTLHPHIINIQVSWPKLGVEGAKECLRSGANDLGGTLINESISRAAGASIGQCLTPGQLNAIISDIGRTPRQRTTLYGTAPHPVSVDAPF
jgi:FO synthase